ncbi:MAG: Kelch repeat-containing protein [Planctomycetota bacterium]|jgi:hypothetical protein
MKRSSTLVFILLSVSLVFFTLSCGNNRDSSDEAVNDTGTTPSGGGTTTFPTATGGTGGTGTGSIPTPTIPTPGGSTIVVSNPTPTNGETGVSTTVDLAWECNIDGSYYIYFGTTNPPQYREIVWEKSVSSDYSLYLRDLAYSTTYFWQIVATDWSENTSGPVWHFVTKDGPAWTQVTDATPPDSRCLSAMAFDGEQVIMFSGAVSDGTTQTIISDPTTWGFNGMEWVDLSPSNTPEARFGTYICFDNRGALMFGGMGTGGVLNDVWRFEGGNWHSVNTANAPGGRYWGDMIWDPIRDVIILFGGSDGSTASLDETWELDLDTNTWTHLDTLSTNPTARVRFNMFYTNRVVLSGGSGTIGKSAYGGTWSFYGDTTWTVNPHDYTSPMRYDMGLATDYEGGYGLLFGGMDANENVLGDLWIYLNGTWESLPQGNKPTARSMHGMEYDSNLEKFVLFGGYSGSGVTNDTWTIDGQ